MGGIFKTMTWSVTEFPNDAIYCLFSVHGDISANNLSIML